MTAALLFGFDLEEGLLVGAVLASTDGAAIFALLRNSTLRRRLARALEGESGLNDPVAVLLVLALIEFDQAARLRLRRRAAAARAPARDRPRGRPRHRLARRPGASGARSSRPPGSTRWPRWRSPRSRSAAPTRCTARASSPSTSPGSCSARPRSRPSRRSPPSTRAWRGSRRSGMFLTLGLLVFPSQLGDIALEGTVLALVAAVVARPLAVIPATLFAHYCARERLVLGWAGLRGAVPVVLATFPVIADVPRQPRAVQHRLLRRARLDVAAGHDVRAARRAPRHDDERARAAAAARRGRHDPPARRGDPRVPDRAPTTRSSATACATSACRATPWST